MISMLPTVEPRVSHILSSEPPARPLYAQIIRLTTSPSRIEIRGCWHVVSRCYYSFQYRSARSHMVLTHEPYFALSLTKCLQYTRKELLFQLAHTPELGWIRVAPIRSIKLHPISLLPALIPRNAQPPSRCSSEVPVCAFVLSNTSYWNRSPCVTF